MEFAHDIRRCPSDTVEAARRMRENITNPRDVHEHFSEVHEHFSELRPDVDVRHPGVGHLPPDHHQQRHPPVHHPPPVQHHHTAHATPAQVPSNSADGSSVAPSEYRYRTVGPHASNNRSSIEPTIAGGLPPPPRLQALHHTTAQAAPPSVSAESYLSTESSWTQRGSAVAHLTRRVLTQDKDLPNPSTLFTLSRGDGKELIKQTSQCMKSRASKSSARTSRDPSSVTLGITVVALLTPLLRPFEFCMLSTEFF